MSTRTDKLYLGTEQKNDMGIRVLNNIENGLIKLKEGQAGRIYHCRNQVDADIYFNNIGIYWDDELSLRKLFNLDTFPFQSKPQLQGLVLNLKRKDYALEYKHKEDFYSLIIKEEKLTHMTFFVHDESKKYQYKPNNNRFYYLEDIVEIIESNFTEWVEKNVTFDEATEEQLENGEWEHEYDRVLDDRSQRIVGDMKNRIELEFARICGVWVEFSGGLIWE